MSALMLFTFMIFFHIIDDFYLQGILAKLKQKSWWEENAPNKIYKHDYIVALVEHAFSWSVSIHIPVFIYCALNSLKACNLLLVNVLIELIVHAIIDDLKANKKVISLLEDQLFHFGQICISFVVCLYLIYNQ